MDKYIKRNTVYPGSPGMIELDIEVIVKTRMASLTQRAIKKLERSGISVVSVERSANRATVHGKLRVIARTPRVDVELDQVQRQGGYVA